MSHNSIRFTCICGGKTMLHKFNTYIICSGCSTKRMFEPSILTYLKKRFGKGGKA
jgi:hypothetical protein